MSATQGTFNRDLRTVVQTGEADTEFKNDDNGGRLTPEGFFELSVQPGQRTVDDIPSRKRAQYRRRYAMVDTLSRQISDGLDQASRAEKTP